MMKNFKKLNLRNRVLLGILCIFLLAGAPAMAGDTLTGCLTPGGTLTKIAPGDDPKGGRCPGNSIEVTLGGSGGGSGTGGGDVQNLEIVVQDGYSVLECADVANVGTNVRGEAFCPDGKQAISGGGLIVNPGWAITITGPIDPRGEQIADPDEIPLYGWEVTWRCFAPSPPDPDEEVTFYTVYAICADVDNYKITQIEDPED